MPGRHPSPGIMWAGAVDCTAIYGTDAFQRGAGDPVQVADAWYDDPIDLLNGRGSTSIHTLFAQAAIAPGFGGLLDATDRVVLYAPDDVPFELDPLPGNATFGFDPAGQASVLGAVDGSPAQVIRATREWLRINPVTDPRIRIRIDPSTWTMFEDDTYAQDVLTLLRARGNGDADDPTTTSIEALDNDANDAVDRRIRWGWDSVGHAWTTYPDTVDPVTWIGGLQRKLGFRDSDTPTAVAGTDLMLLRASDPPEPTLTPSRPARVRNGVERLSFGGDLTDGDATRNIVYRHHTRDVTWFLDGPDDVRNLASHYEHRHRPTWQHQVTLYQQWPGELRRALPHGVRINAGLDDYDLVYTTEEDGRRGRLVCTLATKNPDSEQTRWTGRHRRKGERTHTLNVRRSQWP